MTQEFQTRLDDAIKLAKWDMPAALRALEDIRESFPGKGDAFIISIRLLNQVRNFAASEKVADQALVQFRGANWPYLLRAEVAEASADLDVAVFYIKKFIDQPPHTPTAYLNAARALTRLDRIEDALDCYCLAVDVTETREEIRHIEIARVLAHKTPVKLLATDAGKRLVGVLLCEPVVSERDCLSFLRALSDTYRSNKERLAAVITSVSSYWKELPLDHNDPVVKINAASIGLCPLDPKSKDMASFLANANWNTLLINFMDKFQTGTRQANLSSLAQYVIENKAELLSSDAFGWEAKIALQQLLICRDHEEFESSLRYFCASPNDSSVQQTRPTKKATPSSRLRIAVLISGQLRGYREAYQTWKHLGLLDHDLSIYVHSWENTGGKEPVPMHADRVFSGAFLTAYVNACMSAGYHIVRDMYPSLFRLLNRTAIANEKGIKEFYGARKVVLENDAGAKFASFDNSMKMYYKIEKCFDICAEDAEEFDLFIRIRPDRSVRPETSINWRDIYRECTKNGAFFVEQRYHNSWGQFNIGDQIGIGAYETMKRYCKTFSDTQNHGTLVGKLAPKFGGSLYYGHRNLAISMFEGQTNILTLPGLRYGGFMDATPPTSAEIQARLEQDCATRAPFSQDEALLNAVRSDIGA